LLRQSSRNTKPMRSLAGSAGSSPNISWKTNVQAKNKQQNQLPRESSSPVTETVCALWNQG
ncbi:MAG: hypothetical protein LJE64_09385, partial [Desulfofustis sp.]|nr:hypothetical protein [Desulfofustis sp.]